jgi:type I restriction enzyme, S subunit
MLNLLVSSEIIPAIRTWKPYPAYKDSAVHWLGEIPVHWETKRLKRLASLRAGMAITSERIEEKGDYPVFGGNGIRGFTSSHTHEGEFPLIGRQGALCGCVNFASGKFWASEHAVVASPQPPVDSSWLAYLLRAMCLNSYSESAAQPGLAVDTISILPVPMPPSSEQRAIAAFLDQETAKIDALVAKKEQLIELLQEKRAALITHAVTKGLDPNVPMKDSGVEWLGEIPAHWGIRRVKHVVVGGLVNGLFKKQDQFGSGVKLINVVDLYRDNFIVDFENLERVEAEPRELDAYSALAGDIFFVRSSLKLEGVAASACLAELEEPAVFECHLVRVRPSRKVVTPEYLVNYLNSSMTRQRLVSLAETTTMTTIAQPKLASIEVLVPPLPEQRAIISYVDRETAKINTLMAKIREGIEKLKEYRMALISAAVTGKIDVRDTIP